MPKISFEFFPPKSIPASFRLWDCVNTLAPLGPEFVSVTYGAGGTTRKLTHEAVTAIHAQAEVPVAAHLTCVDATRKETLDIAKSYADAGVRDIVALRGDPPKGSAGFQAHADGFADSVALVSALADTGDFNIAVGGYPESHPEAASMADNVAWLKRKCDAGANRVITQFFFEADTFFRFRDACADAGITADILPGILPVENWKGVQRFAQQCGAEIPPLLAQAFDKAQDSGDHDLLATAVASELCDTLVGGGVDHLHFYTLNTPQLTFDVCRALGIRPKSRLQKVA